MGSEHPVSTFLICRSGTRLCALPLAHVAETMRPLPTEPLPGMPAPMLGVATIRAALVPVIDVAALTGVTTRAAPGRFVTLRLGSRQVALAMQSVVGVRELDLAALDEAVPPLLRESAPDVIATMALLDAELMLVLQTARLIPEAVWEAVAGAGAQSAGALDAMQAIGSEEVPIS